METDASQKNAFIMAVIVILLLLVGSIILLLYNFNNLSNSLPNDPNEKYYCSQNQREIEICTTESSPVCGYLNKTISCDKSFCSEIYSNPCMACINSSVEYYTMGECILE